MKIKYGFEGERFIIVPYQFIVSMARNPLCSDLFIHSIGNFSNARHHYISRPKGRNECILIYCKSGRGWICVGDTRYEIGPNQVFVIPSGTPHSYGADDSAPWTIYWIHFMGTKAGVFARRMVSLPLTIEPSEESRIKDRLDLFEEIYATLYAELSEENISYANLCLAHFLGTLLFLKPFRSGRLSHNYLSTKVNSVIYYMNENISEKLTIQDFAAYIGYSESYFYRIFIRETGYAPIEYFNRLKINRACEYLLHSSMNVMQIAHILGFTDSYYFSRMFSRIMKISPVKYRNCEGNIPSAEPAQQAR